MKKIAIVLFDEVEVLDFAGPFEVFSVTGKRNIGEPYEVFTVAEKETIAARNNLVVKPTYLFEKGSGGRYFSGTRWWWVLCRWATVWFA
jgi:putative intracellular protease/amidase